MAVYSKDEALVCKVFPSSLGPVAMRWFNGLRANSIDSFKKLTRAFGARFITCSRVSRPLGSLLSMSMREGETLKAYSDIYWEMFNEIEREYDDVAISTFKAGIPAEHDLRKSLIGKPVTSPGPANTQAVNAVFREPVQQVLEKNKNELFFKWPNKMAGDPMRRNQNLYCLYHQDHGHTTEDCRNLWYHLDQLVREGKLKQLLHHSSGRVSQAGSELREYASSKLPIGTINVIFAAPGRTRSCPSRVMSASRSRAEESSSIPKRAKLGIPLVLSFSDEDKVGIIQPHGDTLIVTLRIGGYDMKRVMIDQGSAVDIIYPDLYRGLNLKLENLTAYSSPLVSFEGRMVVPKGQIRLPMQADADMVEVDFIVVDVFSPYTTIMGRPWFHMLGAVSSTLHQKVKYPSGGQVLEIVGSQVAARQCLVAAIQHRPEAETSTIADNGL
ncbi:uncharacterized protein LOC115949986 [Quercus lobata]|uniref:uncharacterized protein LOC115949986 n=1 Tax=Quercus lobata TaxID=97700 RepID=UPI001247D154|nr:uncharacterized protein LOC115949986 [Quercus lobata]